jgi:hypothetical protein
MAIGPMLGAATAALFGLHASFLLTAVALLIAGVWIAVMVRGPIPEAATTTIQGGRT